MFISNVDYTMFCLKQSIDHRSYRNHISRISKNQSTLYKVPDAVSLQADLYGLFKPGREELYTNQSVWNNPIDNKTQSLNQMLN